MLQDLQGSFGYVTGCVLCTIFFPSWAAGVPSTYPMALKCDLAGNFPAFVLWLSSKSKQFEAGSLYSTRTS